MELVYALLFVCVAWVDWRARRIWHAVTLPALVGAVVLSRGLPVGRIPLSLVGIAACGGLFLTIFLIVRRVTPYRPLGFGDVMLAALIGAVFGPVSGVWVLALGMVAAGAFALFRLAQGAECKEPFAYGAFIAISAATALLLW